MSKGPERDLIKTIKGRYWRKDMQQFRHFADCHFHNSYGRICTCGLLHWLLPHCGDESVEELLRTAYKDFEADMSTHQESIGIIEYQRMMREHPENFL